MYNNKNSQDQIIRKEKSSNLIINWVNYYVKKEQENAIGITLIYIIVGSGIASITGALAVKNPHFYADSDHCCPLIDGYKRICIKSANI